MTRYHVHIYADSHPEHMSQIYTGFGALESQNLITTRWSYRRRKRGERRGILLDVEMGGARLTYCVSDSYTIDDTLPNYAAADVILKRSYNPDYLKTHPLGGKVLPLGLNYFTISPRDHGLRRALSDQPDKRMLLEVMRRIEPLARLRDLPFSLADAQPHHYEAPPNLDPNPLILFSLRLWDPARISDPALRAEREQINATRRELVERLRATFGERFIGGIAPEYYAKSTCPPELLHHPDEIHHRKYLEKVKRASICIATTGLQGSIGWKFAEYVAASRAIVAEANENTIYGDFREGENALTFRTIDECLAHVDRLMTDAPFRQAMMMRNQAYYQQYLRPDRLVLNSLDSAARFLAGEAPRR